MNRASSSNDKPKFYVTTPIYCANSRLHVGSAYSKIMCDPIARLRNVGEPLL